MQNSSSKENLQWHTKKSYEPMGHLRGFMNQQDQAKKSPQLLLRRLAMQMEEGVKRTRKRFEKVWKNKNRNCRPYDLLHAKRISLNICVRLAERPSQLYRYQKCKYVWIGDGMLFTILTRIYYVVNVITTLHQMSSAYI